MNTKKGIAIIILRKLTLMIKLLMIIDNYSFHVYKNILKVAVRVTNVCAYFNIAGYLLKYKYYDHFKQTQHVILVRKTPGS